MIRALGMVLLTAMPALADEGPAGILDLVLGMPAGEIGGNFIEHACGSNGGPPLQKLSGFADFMTCKPEESGLREVYFRYDDELEYMARALEQADLVALYRGTKIYEFPIVASALFDEEGRLAGIRMMTDARDGEIRPRHEHWLLGNVLRNHFGADGWTCIEGEAEAGESAIGDYFIKTRCEAEKDGAHLVTEQRYLHKRGQSYRDPHTGQVQADIFESWTRFEMVALP